MGKQKQLSISRFFAPKSANSHPPPPPNPPTPPPKISATVEFSPAKRARSSELLSSSPLNPSKKPKLSPHTQNSIPSFPQSDPTLHQKFLQKLLEPPDHLLEPTIKKPSSLICSNPKYTPLEQQVVELKDQYPDVVLMIEVGYKYRFFGKDAEIAARVLGIYAHVDHNFLTASVPTFRLNVHVRRLVGEGYKVGVVKQTETASIKAHGSNRLGPFCRGLSALYTRATIEAAEDLGGVGGEEGCGSFSNYLFCVVESEVFPDNGDCGVEGGFLVKIGVVAVEISTGDVIYGEFNDNFMRSGLEAMLLSLSPAELLLGEPLSKQTTKLLLAYAGPASNVRVERASYDSVKDGGALVDLMALFENTGEDDPEQNTNCSLQLAVATQEKPIMAMPGLAAQALALAFQHLKQFGLERIMLLGASFRSFSSSIEMSLSANALQQLEVLINHSDGSETGSLFQTMNQTLTIYGSRMLKHWVTHPLCDRNMIIARLDAVTEIAESMGGSKSSDLLEEEKSGTGVVRPEMQFILSSVLTTLGRSTDIQRGITRIFHRTATPSEFIAVVEAILFAGKQLLQLCDGETDDDVEGHATVQSSLLQKLIQTASSSTVISSAAKLLSSLNTEAALKGDMLNLITVSNDQFLEVGEARAQVGLINEKLKSLIQSYRKQLGRNLEFLSVSGTTHLIELPSDARVPPSWVKVNSTKKTVRYHPPEVLTALDKLSLANEKLTLVCRAAWNSFLGEFAKHYSEFQACVQALAALDCLHSLAILSRNKDYIRPVFVDDNEPNQIKIASGRHPVLESMLQDNFVPNNTSLHADREYCQIVTGPNMGGKSCYIRQVALIVIMAQVGSFVPARAAELHVVDAVHTRMGASDNIQQGRSTFMEELNEASHIIRNCTSNSLVILDELGRGTSTHDGVAIAYATLHYLLEQKRCMVLFVTHYPKIADIRKQFPDSVGTYHVSYLTSKTDSSADAEGYVKEPEDVTYLYKLVPGISERSFGFKVAQIAQLPESCVARGMVMAAKLEKLVQRREEDKIVVTDWEDGLMGVWSKFFGCLKSALRNDDEETSFGYLKDAHNTAAKLTSM